MKQYIPLIVFGSIAWTILCLVVGAEMRDAGWMYQAIDNQCAQYNQITGDFEWVKP